MATVQRTSLLQGYAPDSASIRVLKHERGNRWLVSVISHGYRVEKRLWETLMEALSDAQVQWSWGVEYSKCHTRCSTLVMDFGTPSGREACMPEGIYRSTSMS